MKIANSRTTSLILILLLVSFFSETSLSYANERISFVTFSPIRWDVFYYSSPDSVPKKLNTFEGLNYDPVLSPDGRWVVFTSEALGNPRLFVTDLTSESEPRLLVHSEAGEDQASFSSDGTTLVFVSTAHGATNIYTLPFDPTRTAEISEARQITRDHGGNFRPVFSPSGDKISFSSDFGVVPHGPVFNRLRGGSLYTIHADGTTLERITESNAWDGSPIFSPDGSSLVYYSDHDLPEGAGSRIWTVNLATKVRRAITEAGRLVLSPAITSDLKLVYVSSEQTRRLFPMYPTPGKPAGWKAEWGMEALSISDSAEPAAPFAPGVKNCWIPKFSKISAAFVCFGEPLEGAVSTAPTQLRPGYPLTMALSDREVNLYSIKGFAAVLHPIRDALISSEPPKGEGLSGFAIVDRCLRKSRPDLYHFSGEETQEPFNLISMSWDGKWLTHMRGKMFGEARDTCEVWKTAVDGTGEHENVSELCPRDSRGMGECESARSSSLSECPMLSGLGCANDGALSMAADGDRFVFRSSRSGTFDIYFGIKSQRKIVRLTSDGSRNTFPAISPDGSKVAFSSNKEGKWDATGNHKAFDLYLMDITPEGGMTAVRQITASAGHNAHVQFSPDGQWLVYASEAGGIFDEELITQTVAYNPQMYGEIYAYQINSCLNIRLTHSKWENGVPSWVPGIE